MSYKSMRLNIRIQRTKSALEATVLTDGKLPPSFREVSVMFADLTEKARALAHEMWGQGYAEADSEVVIGVTTTLEYPDEADIESVIMAEDAERRVSQTRRARLEAERKAAGEKTLAVASAKRLRLEMDENTRWARLLHYIAKSGSSALNTARRLYPDDYEALYAMAANDWNRRWPKFASQYVKVSTDQLTDAQLAALDRAVTESGLESSEFCVMTDGRATDGEWSLAVYRPAFPAFDNKHAGTGFYTPYPATQLEMGAEPEPGPELDESLDLPE